MSEAIQEGYRQAELVARSRARNFYYAFVGQPPAARRALHAIYAFCREADDAADDGRAAGAARAALARLRSRLEEVYAGVPEELRDLALQHAVRTFGVRRGDFVSLMNGVEQDLEPGDYATFDELYAYCFQVAASVGLLCLPVFGRRDALARRHAVDLGIGMQLTNILRDLAEDAGRGRVYVPASDLRRFGIDRSELARFLSRENGASWRALDELVRFEAARARGFLVSGRELLPLLALEDRFCPTVLAGIYGELLERIAKAGSAGALRRVGVPGLTKAWLALLSYVRTRDVRWGARSRVASPHEEAGIRG